MLRSSLTRFVGGAATATPSFFTKIESHSRNGEFTKAAEVFEKTFASGRMTVTNYCNDDPSKTRDFGLTMMRVYTSLGKMSKVRDVFQLVVNDELKSRGRQKGGEATRSSDDSSSSSPGDDKVAVSSGLSLPPSPVLFDAYLEAMTKRTSFSRDEVRYILTQMNHLGVKWTPLTYQFLIEMHVRMNKDPIGLWFQMLDDIGPDEVTIGTAKLMFNHVIKRPNVEARYAISVARNLIGKAPVERKNVAEIIALWLDNKQIAPEYILWLLFELEQSCILEKVPLNQNINKSHIVAMLYRCAQVGDTPTGERTLALLERHGMVKSADIMALIVRCYSQSGEIEKAFDAVELMARKGFLDFTDPFKKYVIESLGISLQKHFLMTLADALTNASLVDRAYYYLENRKEEGKSVSVHSLDVIVLACSKIGDEVRAVETLESYAHLGVEPRNVSYNCLLLACATSTKADIHDIIFDAMLRNGVAPTNYTFRLLIRQAVARDDVDEAIAYLEKVPKHPGVVIEVEMILPIISRAGRAGDIETCLKLSKFAIECNIGIDLAVLKTVAKNLEAFGLNTNELMEGFPTHEKLRSRKKSRKRPQYNISPSQQQQQQVEKPSSATIPA